MKTTGKTFRVAAVFATVLLGANATAQQQSNDGALEEILVTAQKRSESLAEVPIAISVFGNEAIDQTGIQELRELGEYIPNVSFSQNTEFQAAIRIRGVGANSRNIGFDSRVGVYLDGVYLGQGPALDQDLVDLDHIEVLRGPQGTLFGKNTVAGAVSLISKKPGGELSADVTANVYNFGGLELKGVVNIPLSETVSARISASDRQRDGYISNVWSPSDVPTTANFVINGTPVFGVPLCDTLGGSTPPGCAAGPVGPNTPPKTGKVIGDIDTQSWRAQLRIQPNDKLDINIAADGLKSDHSPILGEPFTDTFGSTVDRFAPEPGQVSFSENIWTKRDIYGGNLNIDYAMGNGYSFRSITAYRDTEINYHNDTDASALDFLYIDYTDAYEQFTQEFQLISPDDAAFKYVVGAYYYNQDGTTTRDAPTGNAGWLFGLLPGDGAFNSGKVKTESWAVFLNGSYDLTDQWRLGFGFRYSDETKDVVYNLDGSRSGVFNIGSTPPGGYIDSQSYTNLSPTVNLSYAVGDNTNIYGSYSTGFKSGGYNLDYITQADLDAGITFDDETVDSYELGVKGSAADNRLTYNIAAFIANYDDYQVNQFFDLGFDPVTGTQLTSIRISNAAKVDTNGLEIEASLRATDTLTFNASLGLLDATFDDFPGGTSREVQDPNVPGGIRREPVNAAGNRLPGASKVSATLGFQNYTRIDGLNADLLIRLDALYTGNYFTTIENESSRDLTGTHGATFTFDIGSFGVPNTIKYGKVDAITTLNGRIGLIDADDSWEVYLWGRNITDEGDYVDYFRDFFGSLSGTQMAPRTYGIEASYHFE